MDLMNYGWEPPLEEAIIFCNQNDITVPNMNETVLRWGRSRKGGRNNITQDHHFHIDTFYATSMLLLMLSPQNWIIGLVRYLLLVCFSYLDLRDSFSKFDVEKLARLTEIYCDDFSYSVKNDIRGQLENFIVHVGRLEQFRAVMIFF
jgi:hypothetical protein